VKKPFISAIIVAGGSGKRFDHRLPKQFVALSGKPIISHSLEVLSSNKEVTELIIVAPRSYLNYCRDKIIKKLKSKKPVMVVSGGKCRQESVRRGLEQVSQDADFVLVHDAVRPMIRREKIEELIKIAIKKKAAILAVPIRDTVKEVSRKGIVKTFPREKFWLAQTPQLFEAKLLQKAYRKAEREGFQGTDCASLVERLGIKVALVEGSNENLKITTKADLRLAETLLELRKNA
jgi:2-C-methyl-D-erythritol 4-phosphate cytidylyltransferase